MADNQGLITSNVISGGQVNGNLSGGATIESNATTGAIVKSTIIAGISVSVAATPTRDNIEFRTASAILTTTNPEFQMVNATAGAATLTLPTTTTPGYVFTIKKTDSTANAVNITATSIDGTATRTLTNQYASVSVVSGNASGIWYIV